MLKIVTTSLLMGAFGLVSLAAIPNAEAANRNTATNITESAATHDGQLAKKPKKGGKKGGKKPPKGPPPRR
jgi:hypothetical protein